MQQLSFFFSYFSALVIQYLYSCTSYLWTYPHWVGVTHISDNLLEKTWHFAALNNFSLRIFMPNLATSLILRSLQILSKIQTGVFLISGFLIKFRLNKNCHNSRSTNDIDMTLSQVTKLYKNNTATSKNLTMMLIRKPVTPLLFFQLIPNLDQSGSRISYARSVKRTF